MVRGKQAWGVKECSAVALGEPPTDDNWQAFFRFYRRRLRPSGFLRALVRRYFLPWRIEAWGKGRIYRCLGVADFGRIVPTGGVVMRRLTGKRMEGYTLKRHTLSSARG